jgi:phage recombination protein Bet
MKAKPRRRTKVRLQPTRRPKPKSKTTAIVAQVAPPPIRWQDRVMPREKIDLLKRTIAKEADDDQLALFLHICQRHGLDPFAKQVYATFFHNDKSRKGEGPKDMVIITGIDGFRKMAARDHKDFGGTSGGKYSFFDPPLRTPAGRLIPESVSLKVHRKGCEPIEITIFWEEFAPRDLTSSKADFWNRMPKAQLEKCCEARGLRKEFPGLGDVFIIEEMAQRMETQTDSGREITNEAGFNANGTAVTHQARYQQGRERAQAVAQEKMQQLSAGIDHASGKLEGRRQEQSQRDVTKPESERPPIDVKPQQPKEYRIIEWDCTENDNPILRGDLSEILPALQKYCTMEFRKGWWHCLPRDFDTIIAFVDHCNEKITDGRPFKVVKVSSQSHAVNQPRKEESPSSTPSSKGSSRRSAGKRPEEAAPMLVSGVIIRCDASMARGGRTPTRQIKLNNEWLSCFRNTIFAALDRGLGKEAELFVNSRHQVVGLKRIGSQEYDGDGLTPITSLHREPGGKTLF